jgi:hypothetical protein
LVSPEYSARKHQVPAAVGVNAEELAVALLLAPALTLTALPTCVPPVVQLEADGPHTKKLTLPVGLPPALLPVTVAESLVLAPSVIVVLPGVDAVLDDA